MPSGSIGRHTLPANYEDFIGLANANMTLPTPEPGYFFAMSAMAARINLAAMNAGMTTAQQFVSTMGGGAQVPPDLARLVTVADSYPGIINAVDEFGKGAGDTIKFTRDSYSTGGLTVAARQLHRDDTISTTGQTITEEEVPLTLYECDGPYASDGSASSPYVINSFDAKYMANKEALASKTTRYLRRDYTYWLDRIVRDKFRSCPTITLADTSLSTCASFVAGGGQIFSWEAVERARKALVDRYWQPFGNGRYLLLVPTQFRIDMASDVDYRQLSTPSTDGRNQIFGYITSIGDVDVVECNTLATYAASDTVSGTVNGTAAGTVGTGVTLQEALLIGPGAVGFGTALNPEVRFADDTDYGRKAKCIWYSIQCLDVIDQRGVQRLITQSV